MAQMPLNGEIRITSKYGYRTDPITGASKSWHGGLDLVSNNRAVLASVSGVVAVSQIVTDKNNPTWEWGNYVRLETADGYAVYLCHLASVSVRAGQTVSAGDVLGVEGSTGKSTGSHCHLEVRKGGKSTDPTLYLDIANRVGSYPVTAATSKNTDFSTLVCERAGLEAQTKAYLNQYKYAEDLWRKLWEAMS